MQVPADQKRESNPLELELQTVVSREGVMGVGGGKDQAIPGHRVLRGQYAQLHLKSCSLIVSQAEVSSQRQTVAPSTSSPSQYLMWGKHTVSAQQTFRLTLEPCL